MTCGDIIELPWVTSNLGNGPIYEVDPKTRKAKSNLQQFKITAIDEDGNVTLEPYATITRKEQLT